MMIKRKEVMKQIIFIKRVGKNKLVAHSASIDTALQTSQVKSRAGDSLYIHSPTRWGSIKKFDKIQFVFLSYLKLEGNQGLDLSATSDNLNIRSLNNIDVNSRRGKVICLKYIFSFVSPIIFRWSSKPKVYTCLKFLCLTPVTMWTVPEDNIPEGGSALDILTQFIKFVFVTMEECFWCCPLLLVWLQRRFVNHKQSFITC